MSTFWDLLVGLGVTVSLGVWGPELGRLIRQRFVVGENVYVVRANGDRCSFARVGNGRGPFLVADADGVLRTPPREWAADGTHLVVILQDSSRHRSVVRATRPRTGPPILELVVR